MTNEITARRLGYRSSGVYSSTDKDEVKKRGKQLKKEGYKTLFITKISKGRVYSTTGWSIWIKEIEK
jgi:hypothetical protein